MIEVKVAERQDHCLDTVEKGRVNMQCAETGSGVEYQCLGPRGDQIAARLTGAGGNPSSAAENRHPHG
jgi:hypothetical protein